MAAAAPEETASPDSAGVSAATVVAPVVAVELPCHHEQVREVVTAAFDRAGEAVLVDTLRADGNLVLALVATVTADAVPAPTAAPASAAASADGDDPGRVAVGAGAGAHAGAGSTGDAGTSEGAASAAATSRGVKASQVVGCVHFSTCTVGDKTAVLLAPLAVLPSFQRRGVGKLLTVAGLKMLQESGAAGWVLVLGHEEYYPKFGFDPANTLEIDAPWSSSPAFMGVCLGEPQPPLKGKLTIAKAFGLDVLEDGGH